MYGDNFIARFKDYIDDMFKCGECDKGENMTADIMEVDLQRRYTDDCSLHRVTVIKSYVGQLTNKKRTRSVIEFDYHISSSGRIGHKALYR